MHLNPLRKGEFEYIDPRDAAMFMALPREVLELKNRVDQLEAISASEGRNKDSMSGDNEILYRKSTDGGSNFGNTVNLSNKEGNQGFPDIAASSN